jgi:hypothetical protein
MKRVSVVFAALVLLFCGSAVAQSGQPGYFPIEDLGVFADGGLKVDVDLMGAMLQVAAGALQGKEGANADSDLAQLVSSLERVRVQVGNPKSTTPAAINSHIADAIGSLSKAGWQRILKVEDGAETVVLFALEGDGRIKGLTGMVNDAGSEVVLLNLVGDIDPVVLGRFLAKMDGLDDFEDLMEMADE